MSVLIAQLRETTGDFFTFEKENILNGLIWKEYRMSELSELWPIRHIGKLQDLV